MKKSTSIQLLWHSYTKGDEHAFGALYEPCHKKLTAYCLGRLKDITLAENVASETLLKLLQHPNPSEIKNFEHWMFTVAKNNCNTYWNKTNRRRSIWENISGLFSWKTTNEGSENITCSDMRKQMRQVLSECEYRIWELHELGYNNEEIAHRLKPTYNISLKRVANLKSQARNKLKKAFEHHRKNI